jgi:hypothetical protein
LPEAAAAADFGAAGRIGWINLSCEPAARFKSTEPDKTRTATDELCASSWTREFGSIVARLLSPKKINAEELEVTISSPVTTGRDDTAVAGTALPFNVSGPELVTLPTGSAAIRTTVVIITISRHKYLTATSCAADRRVWYAVSRGQLASDPQSAGYRAAAFKE